VCQEKLWLKNEEVILVQLEIDSMNKQWQNQMYVSQVHNQKPKFRIKVDWNYFQNLNIKFEWNQYEWLRLMKVKIFEFLKDILNENCSCTGKLIFQTKLILKSLNNY